MKKKFLISFFAAVIAVAAVATTEKILTQQEPINIETVSDTLGESELSKEDEGEKMKISAKAAVLIDGDTGKVLFEQNSHKELPPASVTKIMTMLLALESVDSGKIKLTDKVTISERAASMGGSQMYMEPGEQHTLDQLMEGVAMVSANDGCVAIAEYVSGSEEIFVEDMNKKASKLGMRDTHFVNTNGLPVAEHYTSAYDISLMSKELIKHAETKKWFTKWQSKIKVGLPGKEKEFGLTNTNKLIKEYPGANGIKTGFTAEAGYCLSASSTKNNTTLIAVVLGCETSKIRTREITKLFNYGYANYTTITIGEKGQKLKRINTEKGQPQHVYGVCKNKVTALVKKGQENQVTSKNVIDKNIDLPLKKGDRVGKLEIYLENKKIGSYPIVAEHNVKKISFVKYYIRKIKSLF